MRLGKTLTIVLISQKTNITEDNNKQYKTLIFLCFLLRDTGILSQDLS